MKYNEMGFARRENRFGNFSETLEFPPTVGLLADAVLVDDSTLAAQRECRNRRRQNAHLVVPVVASEASIVPASGPICGAWPAHAWRGGRLGRHRSRR
jgi:hypothetical protein